MLNPMLNRFFIATSVTMLVVPDGLPKVSADQPKPNVVFILADDLGWTDLGCYGSAFYETPHIDRLCEGGMKFTNAYTNGPNCAPTRACLLSGRYTPRHGVYTVHSGARGLEKFRGMIPVKNRTDLSPEITTIAEALKGAGYATGHFGKWGLAPRPAGPQQQGFDVYVGRRRKSDYPETERLTEEAIRFISNHKDEPFFLYLPYLAVHTPLRADEQLISKYKKKKPVRGHGHAVYAAMIEQLDRGVGRIVAKLDELGLNERTVVMFMSDNGGMGGYEAAGINKAAADITSNAPLRGGKGMLYEGGIRVPLIVRWPGVVGAGSVCHEAVATIDFYPTFLELAGAKSDPKHPLDGVSLVPLFKSAGCAKLQRDALYWHFPGYLQADVQKGSWRTTPAGAIRSGDYKLIEFFEDDHIELYNLKEDIGEIHDLGDEMPEKAKQLRGKLIAWRRSVNAPMPLRKVGGGRAGDRSGAGNRKD